LKREGAVFELHDHAMHCSHGLKQIKQLQPHRLILAIDIAIGDAEEQRVTDISGGAGDGDGDGRLVDRRLMGWRRRTEA
jgi:hypothetical protein